MGTAATQKGDNDGTNGIALEKGACNTDRGGGRYSSSR